MILTKGDRDVDDVDDGLLLACEREESGAFNVGAVVILADIKVLSIFILIGGLSTDVLLSCESA